MGQLNSVESSDRLQRPGDHFVRNRWGKLKHNLSDVVLAEKRRTMRGGQFVTVDEEGAVCSDDENAGQGGGSPLQGEQQQQQQTSYSQNKRGSFSESR